MITPIAEVYALVCGTRSWEWQYYPPYFKTFENVQIVQLKDEQFIKVNRHYGHQKAFLEIVEP